jgi:acyl-CoA synthetase (AMP-forming)/AMP-acid ligase II
MIFYQLHLTQFCRLAQMRHQLQAQPERLPTLRLLTGGNPRTTVMLYELLGSGQAGHVRSDLEALLRQHPAVEDVAVVGVPSEQWGETPVACVVRRAGDTTDAHTLQTWHNERSGKIQRLASVQFVHELPRSAIGKVLKRELRERLLATSAR